MTEFSPIRQEFNVRYGYDVHFTSGLFREDNLLLLETLATDKKGSPARMLVAVDEGVAQSHRGLLGEIDAYVKRHRDRLQLVSDPLRVPGGEQCKNTVESLDLILKQVNDFGIDRHSYILAIGGGAVLDMAGYAAALAIPRSDRRSRLEGWRASEYLNRTGLGPEAGVEPVPAFIVIGLELRAFERKFGRPHGKLGLEHKSHRVADLLWREFGL